MLGESTSIMILYTSIFSTSYQYPTYILHISNQHQVWKKKKKKKKIKSVCHDNLLNSDGFGEIYILHLKPFIKITISSTLYIHPHPVPLKTIPLLESPDLRYSISISNHSNPSPPFATQPPYKNTRNWLSNRNRARVIQQIYHLTQNKMVTSLDVSYCEQTLWHLMIH